MRSASLVLVALLVAGCASPGPAEPADPAPSSGLDGLDAPGAVVEDLPSGARTLTWEGEAPAGARTLVGDVGAGRSWHELEVDARVGGVEVNLTYDGPWSLDAMLVDDEGRLQCGTLAESPPKTCGSGVRRDAARGAWRVGVGGGPYGAGPDARYRLSVTLLPRALLVLADGTEGVDPSIRFRLSDTGVPGFEPTVGVLADGTLLAQEMLRTMRSRDDGRTWEDVTPPATPPQTLDPMMRADPWSGRVYVDHLYVGCSVLSWSDDAGETWVTNPVACGMPVNDHQKLAVGPSPLPLSPFPVVYYSFFSFAKATWVSRSLDGGVTFTTTPIRGPPDMQPINTGPIEADREGNAYVPLYLCDNGGWIGVGVSHDFGAGFRVVKVSAEKGECHDLDPGVSVDAEGTVYLAYHRPGGVRYAFSHDRGETWSKPVDVTLPGQLAWRNVDVVAGDAGRIAVAYRSTFDSAKPADAADGWAAWRMYVAFVENATSGTPRVRTALASDVTQRGPICQRFFPPCAGEGARNLGDFIDVAVGPDGRVHVAYDDGCADPCDTPADSKASLGIVAVQEEGPRLFAEGAPWATRDGRRTAP